MNWPKNKWRAKGPIVYSTEWKHSWNEDTNGIGKSNEQCNAVWWTSSDGTNIYFGGPEPFILSGTLYPFSGTYQH